MSLAPILSRSVSYRLGLKNARHESFRYVVTFDMPMEFAAHQPSCVWFLMAEVLISKCLAHCLNNNQSGDKKADRVKSCDKEARWRRQNERSLHDSRMQLQRVQWTAASADTKAQATSNKNAVRTNPLNEKTTSTARIAATLIRSTESIAFSALTLLVGHQEEYPACKYWLMSCWRGYLSGARCKWFAYGPADATATPLSLASLNPELFSLSDTGLPRLSWKRGR